MRLYMSLVTLTAESPDGYLLVPEGHEGFAQFITFAENDSCVAHEAELFYKSLGLSVISLEDPIHLNKDGKFTESSPVSEAFDFVVETGQGASGDIQHYEA